MARYVLDTNILVYAIRNHDVFKQTDKQFNLIEGGHQLFISVVTLAEIRAMALKQQWGNKKLELLNSLIIVDVSLSSPEILNAYTEMDVYSQNGLSNKKLPQGKTARRMGKNDLWIAATAHATGAELITTDGDFENLNKAYITVNYIRT